MSGVGGVRIRHYLHKSVLVVIRDRARPLPSPLDCHLCGTHPFKTYHFELDETGSVLVSLDVWKALQAMVPHIDASTGVAHAAAGFELVNHVPDPPTQRITVRPLSLDTKASAPAPTRRERVTQ